MLERVAVGQVRFNLPGLTLDGRGVAAGRQMAVRFGAVDRLVSFLRILSSEQSLDDVPGGLRILFVRSGAGLREVVTLMALPSTGWGDAAARAARSAHGEAYTGGGRHLVLWRDSTAPLGWDLSAPPTEAGDVVLHGLDGASPCDIESELSLQKLLLRLEPQRDPSVREPPGDELYLTVRRGLGPTVAAYMMRSGVRAAAALVDAGTGEGAFGRGRSVWLLRLAGAPRRMSGLLAATPGFELFVPAGAHVAVAYGYRHPIHLDACQSVFPADQMVFFTAHGAPLVVAPMPPLAPVQDIVEIKAPSLVDPRLVGLKASVPPPLSVPLQLVAGKAGRARVCAALLPWSQASWLRRVCYALPGTTLAGHRVALLERGLLVLSPADLAGLPFGTLLEEAAPSVLVPAGHKITPAVAPDLLAARTGATGGAFVVFPGAGEPPFRVPGAALVPLERHLLAELDIAAESSSERIVVTATEPVPIDIENEHLGPMPLWGVGR